MRRLFLLEATPPKAIRLQRANGDICIEHIVARKPSKELFETHPRDKGTLGEALELTWEDDTKLLTINDTFVIPKTLRQRDAARV